MLIATTARPLSLAIVLLLACATACLAFEWQLTTGDSEDEDPEWLGNKICFSSDRDPSVDHDIWVIEVDDVGQIDEWYPRVTTSPTADDRAPSWQPNDNTFLYFQRFEGAGDWQIKGIATSGSFDIDFSVGNGNDEAPDLSSAGMLVHSDRSGNDDIVWMDGGGESQGWGYRTTDPAQDRYPCWSPDNNWIVFTSDRSGNWDIWVMSAAGEGDSLRQLTATPENESKPAWSPSGSLIAFAREGVGIVATDVAGRAEHQVTSGGADSSPTWSEDSSMLMFTRGSGGSRHLWVTDNVPDTGIEEASWGVIKAMFR